MSRLQVLLVGVLLPIATLAAPTVVRQHHARMRINHRTDAFIIRFSCPHSRSAPAGLLPRGSYHAGIRHGSIRHTDTTAPAAPSARGRTDLDHGDDATGELQPCRDRSEASRDGTVRSIRSRRTAAAAADGGPVADALSQHAGPAVPVPRQSVVQPADGLVPSVRELEVEENRIRVFTFSAGYQPKKPDYEPLPSFRPIDYIASG